MRMHTVGAPLLPEPLLLDEVSTPRAVGPFDVVVRVAAAGVCRTDLHLLTGEMAAPLPLVLGHENAGWVHEVGAEVTSVSVGDPVICFPFISGGLSAAERAGLDTHAPDRSTPGITVDGCYAEFLLTNERAMLKVDAGADLAQLCTLTDAGLAAYRACKRAAALLRPGDRAVVLGGVPVVRCDGAGRSSPPAWSAVVRAACLGSATGRSGTRVDSNLALADSRSMRLGVGKRSSSASDVASGEKTSATTASLPSLLIRSTSL